MGGPLLVVLPRAGWLSRHGPGRRLSPRPALDRHGGGNHRAHDRLAVHAGGRVLGAASAVAAGPAGLPDRPSARRRDLLRLLLRAHEVLTASRGNSPIADSPGTKASGPLPPGMLGWLAFLAVQPLEA